MLQGGFERSIAKASGAKFAHVRFGRMDSGSSRVEKRCDGLFAQAVDLVKPVVVKHRVGSRLYSLSVDVLDLLVLKGGNLVPDPFFTPSLSVSDSRALKNFNWVYLYVTTLQLARITRQPTVILLRCRFGLLDLDIIHLTTLLHLASIL